MTPKNKVWFDEETHCYFADEERNIMVPNYSSIVRTVLGDDFESVPAAIRENALLRGKAVHKITELFDKNETVEISDKFYPYLLQWVRFLKDSKLLNEFEFDLIEVPLLSKIHWFATTPDRFIKKTLINIKTGNKYKNHRLQSAAESIAIEENFGIKVEKRLTVILTDSIYKVIEHDDPEDFDYFLGINKTFQWKEFEK